MNHEFLAINHEKPHGSCQRLSSFRVWCDVDPAGPQDKEEPKAGEMDERKAGLGKLHNLFLGRMSVKEGLVDSYDIGFAYISFTYHRYS